MKIVVAIVSLLLCSVAAAETAVSNIAPLAVEEIAPGIFVHRGVEATMAADNLGGIANLGFIAGEEAVAVIDTGGSVAQGRALLAAIRLHSDKPVRFVVNTHVHPDHWFGNAAFEELNAEYVGHARLAAALSARGAFYREANRAALGDALVGEVRIVAPDTLIEDRITLDLGNRTLIVQAWPVAHTDNDLTVFDETTRTLFTGDLLFIDHLPVVDGSLTGWLSRMDELAKIEAVRAVPGHGPASATWPQGLDEQRRYLSRLAEDLRQAIAEGVPMARAVESAGLSERGRWDLFDLFNRRNATAGFAELEWE